MALARIVNLHNKWVRYSPKGAMSDQCQDLNALHSLVVDGGSVKIPDRLLKPPEDPDVPFILDLLRDAAKEFHDNFMKELPATTDSHSSDRVEAEALLVNLLTSEKMAVSEYELAMMAGRFAEKHGLDLRRQVGHIDFSAFSAAEKHAFSFKLGLTPHSDPYIWNSLMRSSILVRQDLEDRNLGGPLRLQRLYSSEIQGRAAFFEYLHEALDNFQRRLLVIKTDDRFSVGVFLRGPIAWDDDVDVSQNVVVCSFMPKASGVMSTYWLGTKGYKLYCGEDTLQLFDQQRGNSFIFMTRPPAVSGHDIVTSIALQKISQRVQQLFDLRFEYVQTEEVMRRFDYTKRTFSYNNIADQDWGTDVTAQTIFDPSIPLQKAEEMLRLIDNVQLHAYFDTALRYRVESHVFAIFAILLDHDGLPIEDTIGFMDAYPSLVYVVLKKHIPEAGTHLPSDLAPIVPAIVRSIIRSANEMSIAALAALERLSHEIDALNLSTYFALLWSAGLCIRSPTLVQEVVLVLHEARSSSRARDPVLTFAHTHALAIVFDSVEEAADACPCDDATGRPRRQRTRPVRATLVSPQAPPAQEDSGGAEAAAVAVATDKTVVVAHTRIDQPSAIRIHSHVRLQLASIAEHTAEPRPRAAVVDAVVTRATRGEMYLEVAQPLPPEWREVDWDMYDAGGTATSAAMLAAVLKLAEKGYECCRINHMLIGLDPVASGAAAGDEDTGSQPEEGNDDDDEDSIRLEAGLNASQEHAVRLAVRSGLCLIWGPPAHPVTGTGKTTVVVQILAQILQRFPDAKVLMTASTHNAVDNVLERFVLFNSAHRILDEDRIIRAATDLSKVQKALQRFTVDSKLGGSVTDNPRLVQKAVKRMKEARMVFTTCSGAGLGVLRNIDFDTVLIDEASQITEPDAIVQCWWAINMNSVQLRPTVRPMGKALEFDKSLFERLYTNNSEYPGFVRTMLEVQYRFSEAVAHFPSQEFYQGRLQTGTSRDSEIEETVGVTSFPWPRTPNGRIVPVVFVPCSSEEDFGRASKSNAGQAALVKYIVKLLRTPSPQATGEEADVPEKLNALKARVRATSVAVLTPYSRQVQLLKHTLPPAHEATVHTIDGFQGREGDVVVFSTVRCNVEGEIGFVEDARRLNVAWTRPRLGIIIVGDRRTLETGSATMGGLWSRALKSCVEVTITRPED
ncbi:P-loop containing nucleoside triphosphate hydrolase protein [Epithele typhae]|uniref:P-loop containing nucleoside triphosphate hydrolase protein n=1 Tax=Epithele typhae TaxID=378194 RepID=UPI0020089C9A|nr:P-loop containing nucleoside triphosphate hydrolase protein [Epithele typhae]KAH9925902.1 P-loop containing nucleoside triphosphate hydrolase protein [Epithele typhae]